MVDPTLRRSLDSFASERRLLRIHALSSNKSCIRRARRHPSHRPVAPEGRELQSAKSRVGTSISAFAFLLVLNAY